ncbi:Glucokinase [Rubripirellula lacrimiformis]|uniref:Glucokinase n=1 Tax=Rubripirellula lacrimiformis TaxID=1930273 RepID=A0A517NAK5_9BACT|nr:ROK family protein [Rubripirellula lacrimiformis]QDT04160.1 Glucokinase [Rubripirellula lacrimiformis]
MAQNPDITPISSAQAPFFWGIDVGGTGIKIGLVDDLGQTLAFETMPTRENEGPTAAMQRVAAVVNDYEEQFDISHQVKRVGLGAPGPMDLPRGYLVAPPQLPTWWDFPIRDTVAKMLERPVSFLNDANAAAFGEFWLGSGKNDQSMLLLTLGTGVGGGIILDGEMVNGVNSFGGECGHIIVDSSPTAQLCVWGGGRGQLEAYASASAVVGRTRQRLTEGRNSLLAGHLHGTNNELTAKKVYEAAVESDELALEIIDETARWLGIGVTTFVHTLDPGAVVFGGAMNFGGANCPVGQRFLKGISDEFRSRTFENVFEGTSIQFASLGADAGYLGVAGYARKQSKQVG